MNLIKTIVTGVGLMMCMSAAVYVNAASEIDADDFVDEASAKGIAEIETSRIALQKSTSAEVRAFAQQMIDDHTKANEELMQIAKNKNLEVATESEMKNKVKSYILKQREGESFDEAYANNQVTAHKEAIELFKSGLNTGDEDINAYAKRTLPKLEQHLKVAEALVRTTEAVNDNDSRSSVNGSLRGY